MEKAGPGGRCKIAKHTPWMAYELFSWRSLDGYLFAREVWLQKHLRLAEPERSRLIDDGSAIMRNDSVERCASCEEALKALIVQELQVNQV